MRAATLLFLGLILAPGAALAQAPACPAPKPMHFVVESRFPRSVPAFTEGFEVHDHQIYESSGSMFGGSRLLRMTEKGQATLLASDGQSFFGEGLTILDNKIFRLTWTEHKVFVYDLAGKRERVMANPDHEGWGMTNDGSHLIFDDGGASLYFTDPRNFRILHSVKVRAGAEPIARLNELEWVDGKIYANVFEDRSILRIDPLSGCVEATAELDNLWDRMTPSERATLATDGNFVLNGIAYDHDEKLFYLTGKVWPMVFTGHFVEN